MTGIQDIIEGFEAMSDAELKEEIEGNNRAAVSQKKVLTEYVSHLPLHERLVVQATFSKWRLRAVLHSRIEHKVHLRLKGPTDGTAPTPEAPALTTSLSA